jgi:hypothetical protein
METVTISLSNPPVEASRTKTRIEVVSIVAVDRGFATIAAFAPVFDVQLHTAE